MANLETLTWLNECFVEKILRNSKCDNSIQVTNIFSKPATAKGDNYASDMIRVTVEFSRDQGGRKITEKKSIIIKLSPTEEGLRQDMITSIGFFDVEILMMSDSLDKMNKLLEPRPRLSGKGLYVQNKKPALLVIEDLAPLGFRMADRMSGLDLTHSILALHGLARFHAASVALCEKEPKQKEMYWKGIFYEHCPEYLKEFFIKAVKAFGEQAMTWPGMKKYAEKVIKISDRMYDLGCNACKYTEDDFKVINHGDCWVNNMLFKYDSNNKPVEHIFVDFQICIYTSPAIDLLYFLSTSPSLDLENKKDVLLNEYLNMLSTVMKELGCKTQPPTMEKLQASLKQRAIYGLIASCTVFPIVLCCKTEVKDVNEMLGADDGFASPGLKSETFKKVMMKRLPKYDEYGLLDL
jgi:hypothetical protein